MAIYYYRYVQAARDGQEQKDCSIEYPNCDIDFSDKKRKKWSDVIIFPKFILNIGL